MGKKGENPLVNEENELFAKLLGQYLKRGRHELGLTQAEFAWKVDMSEEGYGMIERGKRIPSALTLNSIHNKTGISIDRIFQEIGIIEKDKNSKEY
jgi:transcriptional regulator with XRE-family HTH domain